MKIGIFGGCFNPPHNMHYKIAQKLIYCGYLDKVIFVPTGNDYEKVDLIDIDDRINMLNLIVSDNMEVSDICKNPKYQYTFEVLDYYHSIYPNDELYFICGTDNLNELYIWRNYEYILSTYKILVIHRNGDDVNSILDRYIEYKGNIIVSSIEESLISSTNIRNNLEENKDKLDEKVYNYIKEKKLYNA